MDKKFIEIATKVVDEKGNEILRNSLLMRALFMDYTKGDYKHEINLLVKIIELGYSSKIIASNELDITKLILSRQLQDELFINAIMADSIIILLIGLLRDRNYLYQINEPRHIAERKFENADNIQNKIRNPEYLKKVGNSSKIIISKWKCIICGQENIENALFCKSCGEYKTLDVNNENMYVGDNVTINTNLISESTIKCFNCKRCFTINIKESDFKETICKYCKKKITLKKVMFI